MGDKIWSSGLWTLDHSPSFFLRTLQIMGQSDRYNISQVIDQFSSQRLYYYTFNINTKYWPFPIRLTFMFYFHVVRFTKWLLVSHWFTLNYFYTKGFSLLLSDTNYLYVLKNWIWLECALDKVRPNENWSSCQFMHVRTKALAPTFFRSALTRKSNVDMTFINIRKDWPNSFHQLSKILFGFVCSMFWFIRLFPGIRYIASRCDFILLEHEVIHKHMKE